MTPPKTDRMEEILDGVRAYGYSQCGVYQKQIAFCGDVTTDSVFKIAKAQLLALFHESVPKEGKVKDNFSSEMYWKGFNNCVQQTHKNIDEMGVRG
jgi:hypothetical protein